MDRTSRRLVIVVVAVAALGYFFYKFRNSITLEGFHWSTVWESLRDANLGLLLRAAYTIGIEAGGRQGGDQAARAGLIALQASIRA